MKSFLLSSLAVIAFVLAGVGAAAAQDDPSRTFEVRLPVTVTQKKNLVTGLQRSDFAILEDGVQQEVTFFTADKTNPPVFVGVLMDTSPSTAGKLAFSKEAAGNFLHTEGIVIANIYCSACA